MARQQLGRTPSATTHAARLADVPNMSITSWVAVTSASGYSTAAAGGYRALSSRRYGQLVMLEGSAANSDGIFPGQIIGTIAAGSRPEGFNTPIFATNAQLGNEAYVRPDGAIIANFTHASDTPVFLTGSWLTV